MELECYSRLFCAYYVSVSIFQVAMNRAYGDDPHLAVPPPDTPIEQKYLYPELTAPLYVTSPRKFQVISSWDPFKALDLYGLLALTHEDLSALLEMCLNAVQINLANRIQTW